MTVTLSPGCNLAHLCVVKFINNKKLIKMEKLRFTIRFIIILAALPVIMFTELTRQDNGTSQQKQNTSREVSKKDDVAMVNYHSPFLQAIL